jgi:hypothetical protein
VKESQVQQAKDWITDDLGRTNILAERDYIQKTLQAGNIITVSYDVVEDKDLWALTPYGAELFRVFFYSIGKEVGKPPTDWQTEFPKVMLKIFKTMAKISDGMNMMNKSMGMNNQKDPFGMEQMTNMWSPKKKEKKVAKKRKKKSKYRKKFSYKTGETKSDDFQFGNRNEKYW